MAELDFTAFEELDFSAFDALEKAPETELHQKLLAAKEQGATREDAASLMHREDQLAAVTDVFGEAKPEMDFAAFEELDYSAFDELDTEEVPSMVGTMSEFRTGEVLSKTRDIITESEPVQRLPEKYGELDPVDQLNRLFPALIGTVETAGTAVTGLASMAMGVVAGGGAAAYDFVKGELDDEYTAEPGTTYVDTFNTIVEAGTYQPYTDEGKLLTTVVAAPMVATNTELDRLAKEHFEATGNPNEAASIAIAADTIGLLVPYLGTKAFKYGKDKVKEVQNKPVEKSQIELDVDTAVEEVVLEPTYLAPKTRDGYILPVAEGGIQNLSPSPILGKKEFQKRSVSRRIEQADMPELVEWKGLTGKKLSKKIKEKQKELDQEYLDYRSATIIENERMFAEGLQGIHSDRYSHTLTPEGFYTPKAIKHKETAWNQVEDVRRKNKETAWESIERERARQTAVEKELAWVEKNGIDTDARLDMLQERSTFPLPKPGMGRTGMGKGQAGMYDPRVFAEGLHKIGKTTEEISAAIVKEFGTEWKTLAPIIAKNSEQVIKSKTFKEQVIPKIDEKIELAVTRERNKFLSSFNRVAGGLRDLTPIETKAKNNRPLEEVLVAIEHSRGVERSDLHPIQRGMNIDTAKHKLHATFSGKLQEALAPLSPKLLPGLRPKLSKKTNEELYNKLNQSEIVGDDKISVSARQIREALNEYYSSADEAGIQNIGYLEGFFPRMWNAKKILGGETISKSKAGDTAKVNLSSEWIDMLRKNGFNDTEINVISEHIVGGGSFLDFGRDVSSRTTAINDALGIVSEIDMPTKKKVGKTDFLQFQRKLKDLSYDDVKPFVNKDVFTVLMGYSETVAPKIASAKILGPNDEVVLAKLKHAINKGRTVGEPITKKDVDLIFGVIDDARHEGKHVIESKVAAKAQDVLLTVGNISMISLAGVNSVLEIFASMKEFGPKRWTSASLFTASSHARAGLRKMYGSLRKDDLERFADELGYTNDLFTTERLSEVYDVPANAINNTFFTMTAQHGIAKFNAINTARMYQLLVKDVAENITKTNSITNKMSKSSLEYAQRYLRSRGMDMKELVAWYNEGQPKDSPFYETQYKTTAHNVTKDSVMLPRAAVLNKYQRVPQLRWLWQFNRYMSMFGNTVVGKTFDDFRIQTREVVNKVREKDIQGAKLEAGILGNRFAHTVATVGSTYMASDALMTLVDYIRHGEEGNPHRPDPDDEPVKYAMEVGSFTGYLGGYAKPVGMIEQFATRRTPDPGIVAPSVGMVSGAVAGLVKLAVDDNAEPLVDWVSRYYSSASLMASPVLPKTGAAIATAVSVLNQNRELREAVKEELMERFGEDAEVQMEELKYKLGVDEW